MKKLSALLLAAALVLGITLPAAAVDHTFGGYWRVRGFVQQNFTGEDATQAKDLQQTDSRTRLFYTAKFSDNFKFVNKFEFDWFYGADDETGDIGADGKHLEIKNSYVDFNTGPVQWKIGISGYKIARGFIFSDDFSGAVIDYKAESWNLPFIWIKHFEGGIGSNKNDQDVDAYTLNPSFKCGNWTINPFFMYLFSDDGSAADSRFSDMNVYYLGANVDFTIDEWNLWGTGIYNGGDLEQAAGGQDLDLKGYLFALGAKGAVGPVGLHGEFFYASGDDNPNDDDQDAFFPPNGVSYYWSEIMGKGIFDNQVSANSPGNVITNIWAVNGGVDYSFLKNLKLTVDIWYAALVESVYFGAEDDVLGTELDIKATYKVMPNLNLDLVAAYLFRGDGTYKGPNGADPFELGARLALTF